MKRQPWFLLPVYTLALALWLWPGTSGKLCAQTPPHLTHAEDLVQNLLTAEVGKTNNNWPNIYGSPASINWNGANSSAQTECSTFATLLGEYSYGWNANTFKLWMGTNDPDAAVYHDTIQSSNGFYVVPSVDQIQPGDVIAIVYYPELQSPSGHVMIVQDKPQTNNSKPLVGGTSQWTIPVIDSTDTYHGTNDTRYLHPGGIGQGIFRLYTNPDGTTAGYTWSLLGASLSSYETQPITTNSGRHLVIGRYLVTVASPQINSVRAQNGNLVISGGRGTPGSRSTVLASTNPASPVAQWAPLSTNYMNGSGSFVSTNWINPVPPCQFYRLRMP